MEEKISVIVPIFNVELYLRQCLDSIVNQTYKNLEVILIDDGSPDRCGAICDEYAVKDSRIIVKHKMNSGLSAAWNDGMRIATGEWIAFVDSDDWLDTDYFENIMASAESMGMGDADIIIAGGRTDEGQEAIVVHNFIAPRVFHTEEEMDYLKIRIHYSEKVGRGEKLSGLGLPWDKLFRREFIREHDLWYDESMRGCADMLFDYRAFDMAKKVIGCTYYGYHYRIVLTGISKKYTPYRPKMFHDYLEKTYAYIADSDGAAPEVLASIDAAAIGYILSSLKLYYFHEQNQDGYKETAKKISELKQMPRYHAAIWAKDNQYIGVKMKVLKAVLRLPFIWPVKLLYVLNEHFVKK